MKKKFKSTWTKHDCRVLERQPLHRGVFSLSRWLISHRLFSGEWSDSIVREVFERDHAVGVLLYDPDRDSVVLVKQFRIGALCDDTYPEPWLVEIVAGGMKQGEKPLDVAKRETFEEAGYVFEDWEPIHTYFVSPGGSSEFMHLFCAKVSIEYEQQIFGLADEHEDILAFAVSREEALNLMHRGEFCNAPIIIALQWLQLHYQRLQALWSTQSNPV